MWNAGLDRSQAGRNINNLRYVDDATLMTESEEELKSLFFFFPFKIYLAMLGLCLCEV